MSTVTRVGTVAAMATVARVATVAAMATVATLAMVTRVATVAGQSSPLVWQSQPSGVTVRLRGVSAVSGDVAWASGAQGTVLRTLDGGRTWQGRPVAGAFALDFRDVDAVTAQTAYALSIGPGDASRIYKTRDGGTTWTLQLTVTDPKMFLDAMAFRDEAHGVAFSDSVDGRFVVFTTANGGASWRQVPADRLPPALPGEGAFAASGTNVTMGPGGRIWIGTTAARVLRSANDGRTWAVAPTPLATGQATGIFSTAFRDATHGVVVGGNYQQERAAVDNVATTSDGGLTWTRGPGPGLSGFRSVVAWWPGNGRIGVDGRSGGWLAVGPSGSDWSVDDGRTWTPAGGDGYDALGLAPGSATGWAAGAGGRLARVTAR